MGSIEKELYRACCRGDIDGVKYYLRQGANMNIIGPTGRTPFGAAAELGNIEILQALLDHCRRSKRIKRGNTPELKSNFDNATNIHNSVKDCKSNVGYFVCFNKEQSVLSNSFSNCDVNLNNGSQKKIIDFQKEKQLPINLEDDQKLVNSSLSKTAYNIATFNDLLIRKDPRFSKKGGISDNDLSEKDGEITPDGMDNLEWDMELEENKDVISSDKEDSWCALYFWYTGILMQTSSLINDKPSPNDIDREDQFGCRALHYAVVESHIDAVRLLINAGCRVNVGDTNNLTPLHLAAAKDCPEVVELLISAGANVHHKTTDRISPLHFSASRGLLDNVKLLINAGANINTLDSSDKSPLFMAVSRSHQDVVSYLVEHGAKVNLEEIHGYTPLYEAVWQKNTSIVKILLDAGAKITQSHHLLHYAVLHRHEEMVKLLLSAGSVINLRDENGDTPLIVAAKTHQTAITKILLAHGASINCTSHVTGNAPLHEIIYSISRGCHKFDEMLSILQEYNVDLEAETNAGYTALGLAVNQKLDDAAATLIRHGADVNNLHIFHPNLFLYVLHRRNRFLSKLFICAGYRFRDIQLSNEPSNPLERWIWYLKKNPMTLCDLCRIKVRAQFKSRVYEKVSLLVLPSAIKTFLKLEDIINENSQ